LKVHLLYKELFILAVTNIHVRYSECSKKALTDDRQEAKEHDEYAVGTYLEADNKLVGHVPMELSFRIFTFLKARHENNVQVKVTGSRRLENGLVVLSGQNDQQSNRHKI